jgi:hypothetical protein
MTILHNCPKCGCAMESPSVAELPTRKQLLTRIRHLERLLADADAILGLCDQNRAGRVHDHMDLQAAACGERDGYGAWMDSLQRMWQSRDQIGCFTVGPCLGTVRHIRRLIASALASNPKDQRAGEAGSDASRC